MGMTYILIYINVSGRGENIGNLVLGKRIRLDISCLIKSG